MLDFKYLRDHIDEVKDKIAQRGSEVEWEHFTALDVRRRELLKEVEDLRCQRNAVSDAVARLKKEIHVWTIFDQES